MLIFTTKNVKYLPFRKYIIQLKSQIQ